MNTEYIEGELHCDFCDLVEYADDLTTDWNGETGNHLSCEDYEQTFTFKDAMALRNDAPTSRPKPQLQLSGQDGNAFFIIGRGMQALRRAGYSKAEIDEFEAEATSGDYDKVLQTAMKWFDWS